VFLVVTPCSLIDVSPVSEGSIASLFRVLLSWDDEFLRGVCNNLHGVTTKKTTVLAAKTPIHYIFTLKMATAMFAETLDNFQHSKRLIPDSRSCT
jgi:hypothetical protein